MYNYGNPYGQQLQYPMQQLPVQNQYMRDLEAKIARLEQGQALQQNPPQSPNTDPEQGFITVESEQEAWDYEDWRILAGQTLYFSNKNGREIYKKKFDANIPATSKVVYVLREDDSQYLDDELTLEDVVRQLKEIKEMMINDTRNNSKDSAKGVGEAPPRRKRRNNDGSDERREEQSRNVSSD